MQWFRFYLGTYLIQAPEAVTSANPGMFFSGSRTHISEECTTVAVSYTSAVYGMLPPGAPESSHPKSKAFQKGATCPHAEVG